MRIRAIFNKKVFLRISIILPALILGTAFIQSADSAGNKSETGQTARKIEFKISAAEPTPGFVTSITVCVKDRASGAPVAASGWTNGCREISGAGFTAEYPVPQTVKNSLSAIVTIKTNGSIVPQFSSQPVEFVFKEPDNPLYSTYTRNWNVQFGELSIETKEKKEGKTERIAAGVELKSAVSNYRVPLNENLFKKESQPVKIFVPLHQIFFDPAQLIQLKALLARPGMPNLDLTELVALPPSASKKVEFVFDQDWSWLVPLRAKLEAALKAAGVDASTASTIAQIKINPDPASTKPEWAGDETQWNWVKNKVGAASYLTTHITLPADFKPTDPSQGDDLMHEWTHELLFRTELQPDLPETCKAHSYGNLTECEGLAFEESLAHFLGSYLMGRVVVGAGGIKHSLAAHILDNDSDQKREAALNKLAECRTQKKKENPGSWIEDVAGGALIETYRLLGEDPEGKPVETLRKILSNLKGFAAANTNKKIWTAEKFFLYLRANVAAADKKRELDQLLLWYLITDRAAINNLEKTDRLVPAVLASAMPAGAAPKTGDPVSVKVSAHTFRRIVGEYRAYGGNSVKVRLYEGATQLGSEITFGGGRAETGYDSGAIFQPAFKSEGTYKLRAEIWGDFIDGSTEKLGETPELTVDIGKGAGDLSGQAQAKYQWLKDALPYLQELLALDERTFNLLEKEVEKQIRKRLSSNPPQPLSDGDRKRLAELEAEFSKASMSWKPVTDPLTGNTEYHFVQEGNPSPAQVAKAKEWGELKARADSEFAFTHYTQQCIYGETEKHLQRQREIKNKISTLENSTPYKNYQEYANLNDFGGYLKAVETLNKQLNLPAPIPRPVTLPWTYSAPCASVSAPTSNAPSVSLKINPNPVKPNTVVNISAAVAGGKPPFKFTWTGDVKGQDANATFTNQKAGEYPVQVTVTDAGGNTAKADAKIRVSAIEVKLTISPVAPNAPFGTTRTLSAILTSDGQPISGNFVYRWENNKDVKFSEDETRINTTRATFLKPGKQTLWVSVLTDTNGVLSAPVDSAPVEIEVGAPPMSIVFNPSAPLIGQETKAILNLQGNVPKDAIDFRWLLPDNAKILMESPDSREITFLPQSDQPVTFTVTAREPVVGTEFGKATATLKASPFNVNAVVLGASGAVSPDIALVNKPGAFAVGQDIKVRASITPQPDKLPVKFVWTVTQDGSNQITSANTGAEITVSRSATGVCEIAVEAFDANNTRIGKAAISFNVTISAAEIEAAKKIKLAKEKLAEAKLIIRKGQLDEAIKLVEEAAALDPANAEAVALVKKWKQEKATVLSQIEKTRALMDQQKFVEASNELIVAKNLHNLYPPLLVFEKEFNEKWRAYESGVIAGMGNIRMALENRQFKKALQLAAEMRAKYKLIPITERDLQTYEQVAQSGEAEKERQRVILKRGEEKYRIYDFAGAYEDLNVFWVKNDFNLYWNSNYDPEPAYYQKFKDDAFLKMKRINELLPNIRSVANDLRYAAPIVEKAIADCDEILKIQPPNAEAKQLRAILLERLRKTSIGVEIATLVKRGEQLLNQGNYLEAINVYTQIIALDAANAEFYQKRASARRRLKDYTNALADYDKAIELNSQNYIALTGRGMTKVNLGDTDGALADFDGSISVNPNYPLAYNERGLIKFKSGDTRGALADFSNAVRLDPTSAIYVNNQGASKEELDDLKAALADYEKSLVLDPNYELAKNNLARVKAKLAKIAVETPGEKQGETGYVDISGARWNWYDPNADASYNVSGDKIMISAPKGNDLWTTTNFDAPRLTKKVSGDFILQTRLRANWRQDYNGSGLTVYAGRTSVIRFERGINGFGISGHHVALVGFAEGRETGRGHILFPNTDLYLRLVRKGNEFTGFASTDGVNWQRVSSITAQFPQTVDAGLVLVNEYNSNIFQTTFSEFKLIQETDAAQPPVSPPSGASRFYKVDLTPAGGKKGSTRIAQEIEIDDASWLRLKSTDENRREIDISLPSPISASSVAIVTNLDDATYLEQGATIARITIITTEGAESAEIKAGVQTSEWNYRAVNPKHKWVEANHIGDNRFLAVFSLPRQMQVTGIRFDYVETNAPKWYGHAPGFVLRGVTLISDATKNQIVKPPSVAPPPPTVQPPAPNKIAGWYQHRSKDFRVPLFTGWRWEPSTDEKEIDIIMSPDERIGIFVKESFSELTAESDESALNRLANTIAKQNPGATVTKTTVGGKPALRVNAYQTDTKQPLWFYFFASERRVYYLFAMMAPNTGNVAFPQELAQVLNGVEFLRKALPTQTAIKPPTQTTQPPPTTQKPTTKPTGNFLTAIFENRSGENVHIFQEGNSFDPANRLAPGEKREVQVELPATGRIKFIAGRNGQVLTTKSWDGDPDYPNRYPHVIFNGTQLIITTGLR